MEVEVIYMVIHTNEPYVQHHWINELSENKLTIYEEESSWGLLIDDSLNPPKEELKINMRIMKKI